MDAITHFFTSYYNELIILFLFFTLCMLFYLLRRVNDLVKKRTSEKVTERLSTLEDELNQYMIRSGRRLDIFKRVIDGFDHIVQNVRTIIEEEEREELDRVIPHVHKDLIDEKKQEEAEIIRLDIRDETD